MNDDDSRLSAVFVAGWSRGLEDAARWHDIQANECIAVRDSARNKGEKNRHERARLTAVAATHADSAIKLRFKLRESDIPAPLPTKPERLKKFVQMKRSDTLEATIGFPGIKWAIIPKKRRKKRPGYLARKDRRYAFKKAMRPG